MIWAATAMAIIGLMQTIMSTFPISSVSVFLVVIRKIVIALRLMGGLFAVLRDNSKTNFLQH